MKKIWTLLFAQCALAHTRVTFVKDVRVDDLGNVQVERCTLEHDAFGGNQERDCRWLDRP